MTTIIESCPPIERVHKVTMSWDDLTDNELIELYDVIGRTSSPKFFNDYQKIQHTCEKYGLDL